MSAEAKQKITVDIKDVKAKLKEGISREAIFKHYGLNKSEGKKLFMDSRLKGLKTFKERGKKEVPFEIVDSTADGEVKDSEATKVAEPVAAGVSDNW